MFFVLLKTWLVFVTLYWSNIYSLLLVISFHTIFIWKKETLTREILVTGWINTPFLDLEKPKLVQVIKYQTQLMLTIHTTSNNSHISAVDLWSSCSWSTVIMSKKGHSLSSTKISAVVSSVPCYQVLEGSCSWPNKGAVNNSNKIWHVLIMFLEDNMAYMRTVSTIATMHSMDWYVYNNNKQVRKIFKYHEDPSTSALT